MSVESDLKLKAENETEKSFILCLFVAGLGVAPQGDNNALSLAKMPNFQKYLNDYPVALLSSESDKISERYWSLATAQDASNFRIDSSLESLPSIIAKQGKNQIKFSASEQLPELNYFFNNGQEDLYTKEERKAISSPLLEDDLKDWSKDWFKEMSDILSSESHDFIFADFPLIIEAFKREDEKEIISSLETFDKMLPKIVDKVIADGGTMLLLSPYGQAEKIKDLNSDTCNLHPTSSLVPIMIIKEEYEHKSIGLADPIDGDLSLLAPAGSLANFAPTVLELLNIENSYFNKKSLVNLKKEE